MLQLYIDCFQIDFFFITAVKSGPCPEYEDKKRQEVHSERKYKQIFEFSNITFEKVTE